MPPDYPSNGGTMINSMNQYQETLDVSLADFGQQFQAFRTDAFRLELLPSYNVQSEVEYFKSYLKFPLSAPPIEFNSDWHEILLGAKARDASVRRCRVIDVLTPYLEFEINWGYKKNIELGEKIRSVPSKLVLDCAVSCGIGIIKDFWLFDGSKGYFLEYDFAGTFLGVRGMSDEASLRLSGFGKMLWSSSQQI